MFDTCSSGTENIKRSYKEKQHVVFKERDKKPGFGDLQASSQRETVRWPKPPTDNIKHILRFLYVCLKGLSSEI